jgi:hypothetical protein
MTFFRDLIADLVTKKLWPVATVLLAAIVAIPTKLTKHETTGGGTAAADASGQRAAHEVTDAQPVVELASDEEGHTDSVRGLAAHDPFAPRKAKSASTTPAAAANPAQSTTPSSGTGGTGGTPPQSTPKKKSSTKRYDTYHVDVRFGELGAEKTHNDVPRLTALPNSSSPIVVFVGVLKDGVTAVFLVTSEAVPHGDGSCKPDKNSCTYIYMKAGDTETLDVPAGTAGLAQYELKVLRLHKTTTASAEAALRTYARESRAGRDIIAAQDNQLLTLRYSRLTGKLYPVR